jgi:hypothetical protein
MHRARVCTERRDEGKNEQMKAKGGPSKGGGGSGCGGDGARGYRLKVMHYSIETSSSSVSGAR